MKAKRSLETLTARTVRLTEEQIALYEAEAERRGWSKGLLIREALSAGLEALGAEQESYRVEATAKISKVGDSWRGSLLINGEPIDLFCLEDASLERISSAVGDSIASHLKALKG